MESNFGVAEILITYADSVYLTFSNTWTGLFLTSGQDNDI